MDRKKRSDSTQLSEKGADLSGGQKARISLARAVYSNADICLMDDPFASVDSEVKNKILNEVVFGELSNKTRILVTHSLDFIDKADKIIIIENRKITHFDTPENLKEEIDTKYGGGMIEESKMDNDNIGKFQLVLVGFL